MSCEFFDECDQVKHDRICTTYRYEYCRYYRLLKEKKDFFKKNGKN